MKKKKKELLPEKQHAFHYVILGMPIKPQFFYRVAHLFPFRNLVFLRRPLT